MLSLQIRLSDRQFNTLLALYFDQWEEAGYNYGKKVFHLNRKLDDRLSIVTNKALESHGLIVRPENDDEPYMKITEKGRKLCEAVIIEIQEWSRHIDKLKRKTKKKAG